METDDISPINVYGRSKADGEHAVLGRLPAALVIRTSSFFGPWDWYNFVHRALDALAARQPFGAPSDPIITPTYVPDLVETFLNLIVDGERGIWHITNGGAVSWFTLARSAAMRAGLDTAVLYDNEQSTATTSPDGLLIARCTAIARCSCQRSMMRLPGPWNSALLVVVSGSKRVRSFQPPTELLSVVLQILLRVAVTLCCIPDEPVHLLRSEYVCPQ